MGTGGGTLFLLARTVAFRKFGACSLGWCVGRALGVGLQGVGGQWPPGGWTEAPAGQSSQPPLEGLETGLLGDG